jgi:EmrB/QacA subfamily drug resistance transporter
MKPILHKNMALAILAFAQLMDVLDTTIVNVAIPTISKALNITGVNNLQWLISIYGLTYAGFLFLAGRFADLFGRRKVFMIGVLLFGVASISAGLSSTSVLLIICRGLQGLGSAVIASVALSLLISVFEEGSARNRAMVIWGTVIALGAALGLVLGGLLTQYINWRWIFFVNVPICALVLLATPAFIPKLEGRGLLSVKKFDLFGTLFLTSGLIALVYGLTNVPTYGWQDRRVVEFLAAAVVLLVAFILNELRVHEPLLQLRLFANRNVGVASLISLLVVGSNSAMLFFVSIYNQEILGYTPLQAGLAVMPLIVLGVAVLLLVRRLLDKFGYKPIILGQLLILVVGLLTLAGLPVIGNYASNELPALLVMALGLPASIGLTLAATSGIQEQESGAVSGVLNTAQQIGGPLVLAVLSTIAATYTTSAAATNTKGIAALQGIHAAFVAGSVLMLLAAIICVTTLQQKQVPK